MIFLNPALLFGLLAASIPVLIHLLNLRKLKRIDFSTLTFLKELQKNKIRKIKLKQWLLLVLRVLIILFLVTAFARPTLKGVAIGGTTSAAKTTAVFILDNTASMSVVDNKGSYLNQAKAVIKEILSQMQQGDESALVLVGNPNNNDIKTTSNLADFQKQVDAVKISDVSGYLNNAIIKAAKILSGSNNFNKEIYVLSDFQEGRLAEQNSLSDLSQILNDKVRIYSIPLEIDSHNFSNKKIFNVGIDSIKLNTQLFDDNKPLDFSVTITNYSAEPANNLVVSIFIDGERSSQQSVTIGPGDSKIISLQAQAKQSGYINAYAEIEDDDILQDNRRYINFFIPKKIPIIIFSDDPPDTRYVDLALSAAGSGQIIDITEKNLTQLNSTNLSPYSLIVIIGSENASSFTNLISYITNGGSVLLMPGSKSTLQNFQEITKAISVPSPKNSVGKINDISNPVYFDKEDLDHPLFQDIFQGNQVKKIESPQIYYHFNLTTEGKGVNIISLMDGSSFLGEYRLGKGAVMLFNTAPILSWSNFPLKNLFAPLITKSIFYLSSNENNESQIIAGNPVEINLQNNASPQLRIEEPGNNEDYIDLKNKSSQKYISFANTNAIGIYKVFAGTKIIDEFSVNSDPAESVVKYYNSKAFEDYLKKINFKGKYFNIDKNDNISKVIMQARFGSELWKYFLLIALILALFEMAVARNAKKDMIV